MRLFTEIDVAQGTPEWLRLRAGRLTGSAAGDMLLQPKKGSKEEATGRRNLRLKLALEQLTGKSLDPGYRSAAMLAGIEREPFARERYGEETGYDIHISGFLAHTTLMAGASLDGSRDDFHHLVSIKCLQPAAHLDFLRYQKIPGEYLAQMRHELWLTGAASHTYVSFNPDFLGGSQYRALVLWREEFNIVEYDTLVTTFLNEVDRDVAEILALSMKHA